jgi:hypothetical protein
MYGRSEVVFVNGARVDEEDGIHPHIAVGTRKPGLQCLVWITQSTKRPLAMKATSTREDAEGIGAMKMES